MGAVATAAVAALAVLTRSNRANRCAAGRHHQLHLQHGWPLLKGHPLSQRAHASQGLMLAVVLPAAANLNPACCCQAERHTSHSSCCLVPTCLEFVSSALPSCTPSSSTPSTAVHAVDQPSRHLSPP